MSLSLPELLQHAAAAGVGPGPQPGAPPLPGPLQDSQQAPDPGKVLDECIQHLHFEVIPALTDHGDTNQAVAALKILTGIASRLNSQANGPQASG